jgi:NAD(P)-dependent dehydrogenase (short-subunit alcohol dehydrogenase family)
LDIANQTIIITGGASGMGAATARQLAKCGGKIALFDLNVKAAQTLAAEIKGEAYECNVTDEASVAAAIEAVKVKQGIARIVVNCAGIVLARRIVNKEGPMPLADFKKVLDINLTGTFNVMRLAANAMSQAPLIGEERGVFVNTASIAAFDGQIGQCAYSASKGGIVAMTLPAARDLSSLAIRVMTIAPGLVETPMLGDISDDTKKALADSVLYPKRLVKPEEFASLVTHIVQNPMLNGEVIRLDGGLRMQPK